MSPPAPAGGLRADGRRVPVGSLDRVYYPETGTTKADLISYYIGVSDVLLPFLDDRPLSLRRFPDGVGSPGFWQKRCPANKPDWLRTADVPSRSGGLRQCLAKDLSSLIWLVGQGAIELHSTLHRHGRKRPDFALFDLDPGPGRDLLDCASLGLQLREYLEQLDLQSFAKSSGKKGLHVIVPLGGSSEYIDVKEFAFRTARDFETLDPERITSRMSRKTRTGKIFIDWSQNDEHKTTVCPLSTRATELPGVSTPLSWQEVEMAVDRGDASPLVADIFTADERRKNAEDLISRAIGVRQGDGLLRRLRPLAGSPSRRRLPYPVASE